MERRKSRVVALAVVLVVGAWTGGESLAFAPAREGGDDELAARIDDAIVRVRPDRPWRSTGDLAVENPVSLAHYRPGTGPRRGWQFSFTPFLWAPAMSGTQTIRGQEVDVDSSIVEGIENVTDNFQLAVMGRFEARCREWSILVDLIYLNLGNEAEVGVVGGAPIDADWEMTNLTLQAMVGYRFAELPLGCPGPCFTPTVSFDALAGVRYYYMDAEIDLQPGPTFEGSQNWLDPVVGLRVLFHVTPALTFNVAGDVGGFGVGSDLSWRLVAGFDYRLNGCVSLDAGWAILDVDYEDGSFAYDVNQSGPYLGATFRF